jgi:outer membrane protein assembly factor BamD (BamD/ComL family)
MKKLILEIVFLLFTFIVTAQEKQFQKACELNTIEGFDKFIEKYPNSEYTQEVEFRKTELIKTSEAYEGFITKYPNGDFSDIVMDTLCNLEYYKIEKSNNIESFKYYLNKYTYCNTHIDDIRKKLTILELRIAEESDFNAAKQSNSIDGYYSFLKKYPYGFYRHDAEKAIEKIDFDKIPTTTFDYQMYLALHPNSNLKNEIENLIDDLMNWNEAKRVEWYSSYELYINASPNGSYIDSANQKINWLKSQKAEYSIDFPSSVKGVDSKYSNVSSPIFSWTISFQEHGGKIGYRIKGFGWYYDNNGIPNGIDNHLPINRGGEIVETGGLLIGPGEKRSYSGMVSGSMFFNGSIQFNFIGEDAGGHSINIPVKIDLR